MKRGLSIGLVLAALSAAAQAEGEMRYLGDAKIAVKSEGFDEPSGLSLTADGRGFWAVSDDTSRIFQIDRDGALLRERSLDIDARGLEGVAHDAAHDRLIAVSEDAASLILIPLSDGAPSRLRLSALHGYDRIAADFERGGANDGLEGAAVHPETGAVYLLKEKAPRMLLRLDPALTRIEAAHILTAQMGFVDDETPDAKLDVSGLVVDAPRNGLWIVSDTAARAFLFDLASGAARSWPLLKGRDAKAKRIKNAEGAALSANGAVLSVVTDDGGKSRLYRYAIYIR